MATTYTTPDQFSRKGSFTTGTEAAPAGDDGLSLAGLSGLVVHLESSAPVTAGGSLLAWLRNPITGNWNRAPDLDVTSGTGLQRQAWPGIRVDVRSGRIAFVPSGLGSVTGDVYLVGTEPGQNRG